MAAAALGFLLVIAVGSAVCGIVDLAQGIVARLASTGVTVTKYGEVTGYGQWVGRWFPMVNAETEFYMRDDQNYQNLFQEITPLCDTIISCADGYHFYTQMTGEELADEIIEMMEDINGYQRG